MILNYRAAQVVHNWAMEVFQQLIPVALAGVEVVIIFSFFAAIRLNPYGATNERFIALVFLSVGVIGFFIFKQCTEFASKERDVSQDFSRKPFLQEGLSF